MVGRPVEGWQTQIRDQQLWVRGPHVMLGYWQDPEATAEKIDPNGWLSTGDLVEQDPVTGQVRILGRADEVIVLDSARKVHPSAVERSVGQVAGVRHAMLVHRQDLERHQLELWIDAGDAEREQQPAWHQTERKICEVLAQTEGLTGCPIHRFHPPLQESDGELTHKGTIRRGRILQNRFPNQAGG